MSTKKILSFALPILGAVLGGPLGGSLMASLGLGGTAGAALIPTTLGLSGATLGGAAGSAIGGGLNGGVKGALLGGATGLVGGALGDKLSGVLGSATSKAVAPSVLSGPAAQALPSGDIGTLIVNASKGAGGTGLGSGLGAAGGSTVQQAINMNAPQVDPIEVVAQRSAQGGADGLGALAGGFPIGADGSISGGAGTDTFDPDTGDNGIAVAQESDDPFLGDSPQHPAPGVGESVFKPGVKAPFFDPKDLGAHAVGGVAGSMIVNTIANALGLMGGGDAGGVGGAGIDGGGGPGIDGSTGGGTGYGAPYGGPGGWAIAEGTGDGGGGPPPPTVGTANTGGGIPGVGTGSMVPSGMGGSPFNAGGGATAGAGAVPGDVSIQTSTKPNIYPWVRPDQQQGAFA